MGRGRFTPFVWPMALLIVGAGLIGAAHALAHIDGFRLYGQVQGLGEVVGVVGLGWLVVSILKGPPRDRR